MRGRKSGRVRAAIAQDRAHKVCRLALDDGLSTAAIAARMELSVRRVQQILKAKGIAPTGGAVHERNRRILELSRFGWPAGEIGRRVDLTKSQVNRIIAKERKSHEN